MNQSVAERRFFSCDTSRVVPYLDAANWSLIILCISK